MKKITTPLMLGLVATSAIASLSPLSVSADAVTQKSKITAQITGGALSLSQPNDDQLQVSLTGAEQTVNLGDIKFKVTDARGLVDNQSGWTVTVASDNYADYKGDYTLKIGGKDISQSAAEMDSVSTRTILKSEDLVTTATISASAKETSAEVANLQWTLSPSTSSVAE